MAPRLLIMETSHRVGVVALACGDAIVGERTLDESRRHARDLAPAIHELLQAQGWRARDLDGVIVSRGPGSYTGLRVGIMSAKTLAFATACPLIAIDTFDAVAFPWRQDSDPAETGNRQDRNLAATNLDVIADAQQNNVYVKRFGAHPETLTILPLDMWLESAFAWNVAVTGPGLEVFAPRLPPELKVLPRETWHARPESLLALGLARLQKGERDDPIAVEPLYLRASSAEEKWAKLKG